MLIETNAEQAHSDWDYKDEPWDNCAKKTRTLMCDGGLELKRAEYEDGSVVVKWNDDVELGIHRDWLVPGIETKVKANLKLKERWQPQETPAEFFAAKQFGSEWLKYARPKKKIKGEKKVEHDKEAEEKIERYVVFARMIKTQCVLAEIKERMEREIAAIGKTVVSDVTLKEVNSRISDISAYVNERKIELDGLPHESVEEAQNHIREEIMKGIGKSWDKYNE